MAQDNLTWSAGGGLTTHTGWDLLNLASGLKEGVDMFCQVLAINNRRHFIRSVRHNTTFSIRQEAGIIHETTTSGQWADCGLVYESSCQNSVVTTSVTTAMRICQCPGPLAPGNVGL